MSKKKKFDALRHETRTQKLLHEHLSQWSRKLLEEFDSAVKCHGLIEDQGYGSSVDHAKARYLLAKRKLAIRLRVLEERCAAYEDAQRRAIQLAGGLRS